MQGHILEPRRRRCKERAGTAQELAERKAWTKTAGGFQAKRGSSEDVDGGLHVCRPNDYTPPRRPLRILCASTRRQLIVVTTMAPRANNIGDCLGTGALHLPHTHSLDLDSQSLYGNFPLPCHVGCSHVGGISLASGVPGRRNLVRRLDQTRFANSAWQRDSRPVCRTWMETISLSEAPELLWMTTTSHEQHLPKFTSRRGSSWCYAATEMEC